MRLIRSLTVAGIANLPAGVAAAAGGCGPNSSIGDYYINEAGQRVWCSSGGTGGAVQSAFSVIGGLYNFADSVGAGKMIIASLAMVVFGVFLTGSERMRVRTYRNNMLIKDEIQGGVEAITTSRSGRLFGNFLKVFGILMFILSTFAFASHI
jgi:hypothetical protein